MLRKALRDWLVAKEPTDGVPAHSVAWQHAQLSQCEWKLKSAIPERHFAPLILPSDSKSKSGTLCITKKKREKEKKQFKEINGR